jgi:hypothetical protein
VRRFELGCGRAGPLEGLSDHLLALRALLEGGGPVGASLPMRASALIAGESCDRIEARGKVEAALELERSLMAGASPQGAQELATWAEEGVRRLLRQAALGELGTDLNTAADETLIATGLDVGDADIAVSVGESPEMPEGSAAGPEAPPGTPGRGAEDVPVYGEAPLSPDTDRNLTPSVEAERPAYYVDNSEEEDMDEDTRIMEPVPAEDEIRISAANVWLDEVSVEEGTMEWTAAEGGGVGDRERVDTPRVRHLFQVPEDADWEVRELDYDHYNRRAG